MADNVYQNGDAVPLQATFKDANGNPADPSGGVTLTILKPNGTTLTPAPIHASTGIWTYNQVADNTSGVWFYTFKGSGSIAQAAEGSFVVQPLQTDATGLSSVALLSLAEARQYALGSVTDNSQDDKLIDRINDISAAVARYTRREWLPVTTGATRKFFYRGGGLLSLMDKDLRTVTSILAYTDYPTAYQQTLTAGSSTVVADYRLGPTGGMPPGGTYRWLDLSAFWKLAQYVPPYFRGYEVAITGDWGIGVIPDDVKLAVKIAVRDSVENPEGYASRTLGPLAITEPAEDIDVPEARWRALPAESRALLAPYKDDTIVVAA